MISSNENNKTEESKETTIDPIKISNLAFDSSKLIGSVTESTLGSLSGRDLVPKSFFESLSAIVPKSGFDFSLVSSSLSNMQSRLNNIEPINKVQSTKLPSHQETSKHILPEDILNISKNQKKIILFDFFDLGQKEKINDFFRSTYEKDLITINDNKSKSMS